MKPHFLALALLLAVAGAVPWEPVAHVAISGSTPFATYFALRDVCRVSKPVSVGVAVGLTFAGGAAKEFNDHGRSGKWQPEDWACNLVPLAVAAVVLVKWGK